MRHFLNQKRRVGVEKDFEQGKSLQIRFYIIRPTESDLLACGLLWGMRSKIFMPLKRDCQPREMNVGREGTITNKRFVDGDVQKSIRFINRGRRKQDEPIRSIVCCLWRGQQLSGQLSAITKGPLWPTKKYQYFTDRKKIKRRE